MKEIKDKERKKQEKGEEEINWEEVKPGLEILKKHREDKRKGKRPLAKYGVFKD